MATSNLFPTPPITKTESISVNTNSSTASATTAEESPAARGKSAIVALGKSVAAASSRNLTDVPKYSVNGVIIKAVHPHLEPKLEAITKAPKFLEWMNNFNRDEIDFQEFNITDVDFFGPVQPNKLGFVKGYGVAKDKATGEDIPAIVFIRGNSVAVLIVVRVKETGKKHVLMCKQLRFPCGRSLIEACAGMMDAETRNIVGVVFNEVKQETGFVINEAEVISLGSMRPSGGGCDEMIHLYAWETEISSSEYEEKLTNVYGEGVHEKIKLIFYDFETFDETLNLVGDAKAECCWRRYLLSNKRKLL